MRSSRLFPLLIFGLGVAGCPDWEALQSSLPDGGINPSTDGSTDGTSSGGDMLLNGWTPVFTSTGTPLNAISGISGIAGTTDTIMAVGNTATVVRGSGVTFTSATITGTNSNLLALWMGGPTEVWTAGTMGQVWRTTDGTSWNNMNSGTAQTLRGIHARAGNSDIVVAGDDNNNGRHWNGTDWANANHGRNDQMYGVWASKATFWVVGTGGDCGTATDPRGAWDNISDVNNTPRINAVSGIDDGNVWAVTENGNLYKFNGPQTQWDYVASVPGSNLRALWIRSATEIWVAGVGGTNGIVSRCDGNARTCVNQSSAALAQHTITGIWGNGTGGIWLTANSGTTGKIFTR